MMIVNPFPVLPDGNVNASVLAGQGGGQFYKAMFITSEDASVYQTSKL